MQKATSKTTEPSVIETSNSLYEMQWLIDHLQINRDIAIISRDRSSFEKVPMLLGLLVRVSPWKLQAVPDEVKELGIH